MSAKQTSVVAKKKLTMQPAMSYGHALLYKGIAEAKRDKHGAVIMLPHELEDNNHLRHSRADNPNRFNDRTKGVLSHVRHRTIEHIACI